MANKKILLTGGHAATTALATTEEIIRRDEGQWDIYWVGTKKAVEGSDIETLESKALPEMGVTFHPITAGRLQRKFTIWTIPSLAKIPIGFFQAFNAIRKIRPNVTLSFGGFASFPVVFWSWVFRIPVIIHEQTSAAGRANNLAAFFAKKIAVSRQSSVKYFPEGKIEIIGNPIMTQIKDIEPKEKISSPPSIFVTGGSRGSKRINELVKAILPDLLQKYYVIHQTGDIDKDEFKKIREGLSEKMKNRYELYSVIDPMQIDGVYKRADLVIARAGANTVSEVIAAKRPSILIPIPWAFEDEQRKNAMYAKDFGVAVVLDQETTTSELLFKEIKKVFERWSEIVSLVKNKKSPDLEASEKLVDIVEEYLK